MGGMVGFETNSFLLEIVDLQVSGEGTTPEKGQRSTMMVAEF